MADFGWPLPPAGAVDKKKFDELISMAKKQWTIFLGITLRGPTETWIVLNGASGEIVFRKNKGRILDEGRVPIIRGGDGACVMRHVYDKDFLNETQNECDIPLSFPEMSIHDVDFKSGNNGIIVEKMPGDRVICSVLNAFYANPERQKFSGTVTVWSSRLGIIGRTPSKIELNDAIQWPSYFAPGKILIRPHDKICPEIWKMESRLELDEPIFEDLLSIHTCPSPRPTCNISKNKHLAWRCCDSLRIVKFGEQKVVHSFPGDRFLGWVGSKHVVAWRREMDEYVYKLINIETGKERILPKIYPFPGNNDSEYFACITSDVEVWSGADPSGPAYVLKHPSGVRVDKYTAFAASKDNLHTVTVGSDWVLRVWRKDKLINKFPFASQDRNWDAIRFMKILDPEMDWVEALGQWLLYSLFFALEIISIILVYLI